MSKMSLKAAELFRDCLTLISPKLNTIVCFRIKLGRWPNLKKPADFREKLIKLKLDNYNHNPVVKQCADKYAVRDFVQDRIKDCPEILAGGGILNELIAVHSSPEEIDWNSLPQQFALKWNYGCGYNIIVSDKSKLDVDAAVKQMKIWGRKKAWIGYSEMQYKGVDKKIIIEKYLSGKTGSLPEDYKIYCFNSKPVVILYISDRDADYHQAGFFDLEWNYLGEPNKSAYKPFKKHPDAPASLETMIKAAKCLAAGFPFVRVDFYDVDGRAVFGEMTFTPAGGCDVSEIDVNGVPMGDLLTL